MLRAVILALVLCLPVNIFLFGGNGALEVVLPFVFVPKLLEALIALGIETEAELSGFRSAGHHWKQQWKQLVFLLTVALVMRGAALYLIASFFNLPHAIIIAAGLIATDPAAMGIALGLVKIERIDQLAWLLTVESLLNDVIALIVFQYASGTELTTIFVTVFLTFGAAFALALADAGARWLIRIRFFYNHPKEAIIETLIVATIYLIFILIGIRAEISLIGMVALGAIMANYIEDLLPHERRHAVVEHRAHYMKRWSHIGLGTVFGIVILLLPLNTILSKQVFVVAIAILGSIFASRFIYDIVTALIRKPIQRQQSRKLQVQTAMVSILAANTLLGVPSVVAAEMHHHGYVLESAIVFAAIAISWAIVIPTVMYISYLERHTSNGILA
jgi:NhaP-type Na+/H+ or K+/H+ antiporter